MSFLKKAWEFFLDTVETAAIAFGIFLIIYGFIAQPHEVKGNSMFDTLEHSDFLLTDKITYRFQEPDRGQIIVFKSPVNPRLEYIKRIIGLPGETIKIQSGQVFINGQLLEEDYLLLNLDTRPGRFAVEGQEHLVPEGQYFVMGDNRPNSSDSREWGFVPQENIIGKIFFRYWPPNRTTAFTALNYGI